MKGLTYSQLKRTIAALAAVVVLALVNVSAQPAWTAANSAIVTPINPSPVEKLAARELRRYLYLATGEWLPLANDQLQGGRNLIVIATKTQMIGGRPLMEEIKDRAATLADQQYLIRTLSRGSNQWVMVCGGDDAGALYGAYRLIETLGVHFYLHGDVVPEEKTVFNPTGLSIDGKPLFALRGIQPFHDFPEGPDWWNLDDYKAYIAQLPKMGMNFIGFHTYPESRFNGHWKAEPLVWIGMQDQINPDGTVKSAYPALHANTGDETWGYLAKKTSDFSFGASQLFEDDCYGADYMKGISDWPHTDAENVKAFDEVGKLLGNAFTFARELGVKTCLGTEAPLVIPHGVQEKLSSENIDPASDAARRGLYEGIFTRIMKTHPLDYYWFWTPEIWTWRPETGDDVVYLEDDLLNALQAYRNVNPPFTLATCGWVLGPTRDRSEFDKLLPKNMPFSCINRNLGSRLVEPGFQAIQDRPKWAITWLEYDHPLIEGQLWAGRVRRDALDAYRYGCSGFMGLHWRTQILSPQIAALSQVGWGLGAWTNALDETKRDLPVDDFYRDWAAAQFGKGTEKIAGIFAKLDGGPLSNAEERVTAYLPSASTWGGPGPGVIIPNRTPWSDVEEKYAFVDEMAACENQIHGLGNQERFAYWLNTFRFMRAVAHVGCAVGQMDAAVEQAASEVNGARRAQIVNDTVLSLRKEAAQRWGEMVTLLLATVNTPGELGTVANLELQNLTGHAELTHQDRNISILLGKPVAPVELNRDYCGKPRIIVPTRRTLLERNEDLNLKIMVLSQNPVKSVRLQWRPLGGSGAYKTVEATHVARGVYRAVVPGATISGRDFEYYVQAETGPDTLKFPVTAPQLNQSVVVN